MSYQDSAARGDAVATFRFAIVSGSLWAIGSSWSAAIRAIAIVALPSSVVVVAELGAALLTTVIGVAIAMLAARDWPCLRSPVPPPQPPPPRRPRAARV